MKLSEVIAKLTEIQQQTRDKQSIDPECMVFVDSSEWVGITTIQLSDTTYAVWIDSE